MSLVFVLCLGVLWKTIPPFILQLQIIDKANVQKLYYYIYYQSASFSSSKDAVVKAYFKDPFNTPTVVKDNTNTKLLY